MRTCTFPEHLLILHELVLLFLGFPCPISIQCMVMLGISILSFSVCSDSNTSLASCGFESPSAISMIAALHFLNSLLWFHGFFGLLLTVFQLSLFSIPSVGAVSGRMGVAKVLWSCCVGGQSRCSWGTGASHMCGWVEWEQLARVLVPAMFGWVEWVYLGCWCKPRVGGQSECSQGAGAGHVWISRVGVARVLVSAIGAFFLRENTFAKLSFELFGTEVQITEAIFPIIG